ncbi:MAG: hypothetical protein ACI3XI_08415 [Eubacteriales bacterium]
MKKRILSLLLVIVMAISMLAACTPEGNTPVTTDEENTTSTPDNSTETTDSDTTQEEEPKFPSAEYQTITIAEALTLCEQFVDTASAERYYIIGTITEIQSEQYGQMTIEDETGSIMVYGSYSADGSVRYDAMTDKPVVGDTVLFHGTLQNYKGNTKEIQNGRIIEFKKNGAEQKPAEFPEFDSTLTVKEMLELPLSSGQLTDGRYYVEAVVESVTNATYGAMNIKDATGTISVYNSKNADGTVDYKDMDDKPVKGDTVKLWCTVQNYNGTVEIKSAYIVEVKHNQIDESAYTAMSIADARNSAKGTKVKVEGVVAKITYATGMVPSGVVLVDGTGSIYVYDGDLAATVKEGNKITVCADKTWWILETEQSNAEKFGYIGCNQLEAAWLVANDGANNEFDKSWITSTTVKDIIDTPVTEDITTVIYKVTALIKEVPGSGFTNFYINDLDGTTGTYSYSQCNGGDFAWLRAFDGKICTVYVMALNAKSTASDCFWRFLPVAVVDEGFDPASVNGAEFAVKYHGMPQFTTTTFTGDPAIELVTSVSSDLLALSGVTLTYTSDNAAVVSIVEENGKAVLHCLSTGSATVTVTAQHGDKTYSETVTITVKGSQTVESVTVKDAIDSTLGSTVTVKGIVGPSLVNQSGFYLIDETGIIAVLCDKSVFDTIEIGNEIVLTGTRDCKVKDGADCFGQTHISGATVVENYYGKHEYSTAHFITDKTAADFYALNAGEDHSTEVYVLKVTVEFTTGSYSSGVNLVSGDTKISLYCSGAGQYSWLREFDGQEVTLEVAACNWNSKTYWRGCVIAVHTADGKVVNELNFAN